MIISRQGLPLLFPCEAVFDIAADIESYPEFMQGWQSARILHRSADGCEVDQVLGLGPIHLRFRSHACFRRPSRIEVTSRETPFRTFSLTWRIEPAAGGCLVSIVADVQLQSRLLQQIAKRVLPASIDETLSAFEARVRLLAGPMAAVPGATRPS